MDLAENRFVERQKGRVRLRGYYAYRVATWNWAVALIMHRGGFSGKWGKYEYQH